MIFPIQNFFLTLISLFEKEKKLVPFPACVDTIRICDSFEIAIGTVNSTSREWYSWLLETGSLHKIRHLGEAAVLLLFIVIWHFVIFPSRNVQNSPKADMYFGPAFHDSTNTWNSLTWPIVLYSDLHLLCPAHFLEEENVSDLTQQLVPFDRREIPLIMDLWARMMKKNLTAAVSSSTCISGSRGSISWAMCVDVLSGKQMSVQFCTQSVKTLKNNKMVVFKYLEKFSCYHIALKIAKNNWVQYWVVMNSIERDYFQKKQCKIWLIMEELR